MTDDFDVSQGKSAGDLGREALWYMIHTLAAVFVLLAVVFCIYLTHPDPDAAGPKELCTVLALLVPLMVGFAVAKARPQDRTSKYIWISGLLVFSVVCVWVLDLPTGAGLCDQCGAVEKLYRTFFDINHGSGLMGGDGLFVGTWIPVSMIGYAIGAKFGLET